MSRAAVTVPLALLALTGAAGTSLAAPTREPDLVVPADMTVEAQAPSGANVSFTASATGRERTSRSQSPAARGRARASGSGRGPLRALGRIVRTSW